MKPLSKTVATSIVVLCVAFAGPSFSQAPAPTQGAAPAQGGSASAPIPQEKLDSLVAPIALYPDQILVQILMASTYPLDVVEAARFVKANRDKLKGDAMVKAAEQKNWDPSVQSLTAYGQVLEMMSEKLDWTQELGDAVLADEKAVLATAQRLRQKASDAGNLKSNEQQKVVVQQDKTIIIEPAQPQTVYIPSYNPTVVYGAWWAPSYPPYYYPPPPYYYPGYAFGAAAVGFGVGLAVGAAWGWAGANWGGGDIDIDVNNNFTRNKTEFNNRSREGGGKFNHDPGQRKGVAYRDQGTRSKYSKSDPGAASARRDYRGHDGAGAGNRAGAGTMDRQGAGAGNRPSAGTMDRGGAGGIDRGDGPGSRGGAGGAGDRGGGGGFSAASPANRAGGGQSFGGGSSNRSAGASSFNSGQSRAQTQNFSNRGASSRASMGGGGGSRGGGGGGRGGGGRR